MTTVTTSTHHPVLGTVLELQIGVVDGALPDTAAEAEAAMLAVFDDLEDRFSLHRRASELSRWRDGAHERPGREVIEVLALAERWFEISGGVFHPATAAVSERWRLAAAEGAAPSDDELDSLAASAARLPYTVVDGRVEATGDVGAVAAVDLNAVAKGWIVDRAVEAAMSVVGVDRVVVNAGGDLVHAGAGSTRVRVEDPRRAYDNVAPLERVVLSNAALATSATSRRGVTVAGRWYGHVIDPRTARPVAGVLSASVVASDAATADVVATVLSVLPPAEGLAFAASIDGVACCIVGADAIVHTDPGWRALRA